MNTVSKSKRIRVLLLSAILILACIDIGAPTPLEPQPPLPPSPTPVVVATEPPLPSPVTLTLPPSPLPLHLPSDTATPIPSPTNTSLPSMPSFNELLAFGGGGGAGHACMAPIYPTPVAYATRSVYGPHVAGLCVYQVVLPINTPIRLRLTSPDGTITLQGDFFSTGEGSEYWLGFEYLEPYYGNYSEHCKEESCSSWGMEFWWPANLPRGVWQAHLSWNGGEVWGIFDADFEATLPEFSVHDKLAFNAIRPSGSLGSCHPVMGSAGLIVSGRGFPPNTAVYIPIFEQVDGTNYRFLGGQVLVSDSAGFVYGELTDLFTSGKRYVVAALTDETLPLISRDNFGYIGFSTLEDTVDCFIVP